MGGWLGAVLCALGLAAHLGAVKNWLSGSGGLSARRRPRRHVIIETNKTTARIFPEVPDCEAPEFWERMERLIVLNKRLIAVGASGRAGAAEGAAAPAAAGALCGGAAAAVHRQARAVRHVRL